MDAHSLPLITSECESCYSYSIRRYLDYSKGMKKDRFSILSSLSYCDTEEDIHHFSSLTLEYVDQVHEYFHLH